MVMVGIGGLGKMVGTGGGYDGLRNANAPSEKMRAIPAEVCALENNCDLLEKICEQLEMRLSTLCPPGPTVNSGREDSVLPSRGALADKLGGLSFSLSRTASRLTALIDSLEV